MKYNRVHRTLLPVALLALTLAVPALQARVAQSMDADNYVIGPRDVIVISIFDQPTLSGKFTVEADGTFTFPHLGPVKAGGLTVRALQASLHKRLSETLFRNPQVTVGVENYRSKRIFMMGEVGLQGRQPLAGSMTLIEALATASGTTASASGEAIIVRPRNGVPDAPLMPGQDLTAEVIRVDLLKLRGGDLTQNLHLQDGDTVYIPRSETAYIYGQVKSPGVYPIQRKMTVLQALSLAGGPTEHGAINRIQIIRFENGKEQTIKVKNPIAELVRPGDTIIVPERWF